MVFIKVTIKALFSASMFLVLPLMVNAQELEYDIDAKCHIEAVGGGELIRFWSVKASQLPQLQFNIIGDRVAKKDGKGRTTVYKAFECVKIHDEFKSIRARRIDVKTPKQLMSV